MVDATTGPLSPRLRKLVAEALVADVVDTWTVVLPIIILLLLVGEASKTNPPAKRSANRPENQDGCDVAAPHMA